MAKSLVNPKVQRFIFTGIGVLLALLSLLTPVWEVTEPASYVGGLLVWAALLEILHSFRRAENSARFSGWFSGAITLIIGTLLINANLFHREALVNFILILFLIDACRYLYIFFRNWRIGNLAWSDLASAVGNENEYDHNHIAYC